MPGLDSETAHQLKKQLRITAPELDTFIDSVPLTRLPVLTETIRGGHFTLQKGSPVLHPDAPVPTLDKMMLLAEREIDATPTQFPSVIPPTSKIHHLGRANTVL